MVLGRLPRRIELLRAEGYGVRERLARRRTALTNQIRGFLLERGLVFAQRPANLRRFASQLNCDSFVEDTERCDYPFT